MLTEKDYMAMSHAELVKRRCDWEPEAFAAFWDAYPRKELKVQAMRAWDSLMLPASELTEMMSYLNTCVEDRKAEVMSRGIGDGWSAEGIDAALSGRHFVNSFSYPGEWLLEQRWVR